MRAHLEGRLGLGRSRESARGGGSVTNSVRSKTARFKVARAWFRVLDAKIGRGVDLGFYRGLITPLRKGFWEDHDSVVSICVLRGHERKKGRKGKTLPRGT